MVDIDGNSANIGAIVASDFEIKVGNDNNTGSWSNGPTPVAVGVRTGAGVDGSDRVELIWNPGSIVGKWVEVTVKATAATGLTAPYTFYFGNAPGETGNNTKNSFVDGFDFAMVRDVPDNPAGVTSKVDFNRDKATDGADLALSRDMHTDLADSLVMIEPPAGPPAAGLVLDTEEAEGEAESAVVIAAAPVATSPAVHDLVLQAATLASADGAAVAPSDAEADPELEFILQDLLG